MNPAVLLMNSLRNNQTSHWNPFDRQNTNGFGNKRESYSQQNSTGTGKPSYIISNPVIKIKEHIPTPDFAASDTSHLSEGQKIEHQKFGFGEVIKMEGAAHNPVATVKFEHNGEKKIMLNYAKLRIVE